MSAGRHRLACLIAVAALAAPPAAWAQGAGDEQYQDPFGGEDQSQSQGSGDQDTQGSSGGDSGGGETAQATPAPTAAPAAPAATTAQAQPAAPQLPRTGGDSAPQFVAGALLLAGGLVLRVRLRPR
jgi:LPXTG-motif cell wall-anchored protein